MKKVLSVLLSIVMLFCVTTGTATTALATSISQSQAVSWANSKVGQALDYDGVYGAQCVDLTKYYYVYLGAAAPSGNAKRYVNGGAYCPSGWSYQSTPQPGDIAVWTGGDYGHVAIVTEIRGSQMVCVEQNYANKKYCTANIHNIDANTYIRPNFNNDNSPIIALDSVTSSSAGKITVTGWAFDNDNVNIALSIHVYAYVDNNPVWVGATTANLERKDVNNAYGCGNYHGFCATFDAPVTGNITVKVAAINIGQGNNTWSEAKAVTVTAVEHNPKIVVDRVKSAGAGKITIRGWAFDPDNTSKALAIHVYTYSGDTAIWVGATTANTKREDVNKTYGCGNYHGFEAEMYPPISGTIKIGIAAINVDKGSNVFADLKTVTVTADTEKPTISNVMVSNITSEGYTVTAKVSDNAAVSKVAFPTWTVKNGQDDINSGWAEKSLGTIKDGVVTYQVKTSEHNNEIGEYITHIYVYDYAGNVTSVGNTKYPELKVNVHDHDWDDSVVTTKATPTATGVKTYTCSVCGATKTETIAKCAKYANPLTVKVKKPSIKYNKKKNQTIALKNAMTVSKAQGTVIYTKSSGNKKITINKKTGKITVKKGLKKGTYKVKIKVKAAGNANYKAATKTVTVTIKVK